MLLKDVQGGSSTAAKPYNTGHLAVRVAKVGHTAQFSSSGGGEGSILNFAIVDASGAMLASLNDATQHNKIGEDKSLHIRNFLVKGNRVILTKNSKIMSTPNVDVSTQQLDAGKQLITPASPLKKLTEVKQSPTKMLCTVHGQIMKVSTRLNGYSNCKTLH